MKRLPFLLCAFAALAGSLRAADPKSAADYNRLLGRGINFGNALEAPREGDWGLTLEEDYFERVKKAGFNSVRLPIRWSAHAGAKPPHEIDAAFFKRIDWAVEQALSRDLVAVLNVHHFDELLQDPDKHEAELLALWKQIAEHYRDRSNRLYFELLNEPNGKLTEERWNALVPKLLEVVRATNPKRIVIVGPGQWNGLGALDKLSLPEKDRNLIVTFHYYSPFHFTHQGAEWLSESKKWKGTTWTGTAKETEELSKDFAKAAAWAKKHERPLFLGEFGSYGVADMDSRARWTRAVAREAEKHGFSWAYWEFGAGFAAYDRKAKAWHEPLLKALTDKAP
ncbi:MAG TPA: glycoside hydrolase family 5 protein [Gemmataceae bacterium]|nr:glycoside hydrolase family 5 protein [Gemmataceae bacterium]